MGILQILLLLLLLLGGTTSQEVDQRPPRTSQTYETGQMVRYSRQYFTNDAWRQLDFPTSGNLPVIAFVSDVYGAVVAIGSAATDSEINYQWLNGLMANYRPWLLTAQCQQGSIQLFEMKGEFAGRAYLTRYWIAPWRADRLLTVHLVFPIERQVDLNHYSQLLFPELPSCAD